MQIIISDVSGRIWYTSDEKYCTVPGTLSLHGRACSGCISVHSHAASLQVQGCLAVTVPCSISQSRDTAVLYFFPVWCGPCLPGQSCTSPVHLRSGIPQLPLCQLLLTAITTLPAPTSTPWWMLPRAELLAGRQGSSGSNVNISSSFGVCC